MKKEIIVQLNKTFEESAYTQNGVEYWLARDLQKLMKNPACKGGVLHFRIA